jgi:AcrR family transcriptional regulator
MTHIQQSLSAKDGTDPRILRSRKMLMESLRHLLSTKPFDAISIQEIADQATLNRATFYLHYPDKHALLRAMTDLRFRALIARRNVSFTDCNGALRSIALGVCDYLAETARCPNQLSQLPLEGSIIPVVETIFREGASNYAIKHDVDVGMLTTAAAWAVFGAARLWFETPERMPAEEMAARIEAMVKPLFLSATQ